MDLGFDVPVWALGFRVLTFEFRVWGLSFRVRMANEWMLLVHRRCAYLKFRV